MPADYQVTKTVPAGGKVVISKQITMGEDGDYTISVKDYPNLGAQVVSVSPLPLYKVGNWKVTGGIPNPKTDGSGQSWGNSVMRVYYPAQWTAGSAAKDKTGAPYPLLIHYGGYSPQLLGMEIPMVAMYEWLGTRMASLGFVVAVCEVAAPSQMGWPGQWRDGFENTLDWLLDRNASSHTLYDLKDMIDPSRIAVSGHSYGGITSFWFAATDIRVKCQIAMAPPSPLMPVDNDPNSQWYGFDPWATWGMIYEAAQHISIPSLSMGSSTDILDMAKDPQGNTVICSDDMYEDTGSPHKEYVMFFSTNTKSVMGQYFGGHMDFCNDMLGIIELNDPVAHAHIQRYTSNWLLHWMYGADKTDALVGAGAQADLASGATLVLKSKGM